MLHAHLPYIRCPEHEHHLEEGWLFEAITETYLPLLDLLLDLAEERVDFRITLSLTPTLLEMLDDPLLRERYLAHLDRQTELGGKEVARTAQDPHVGPLARRYLAMFRRAKKRFAETYRCDLPAAFRMLAETGCVELITSAACHAYLPSLMQEPAAARAQIEVGVRNFRKRFNADPAGIWLPECGYAPGIEPLLKDAGIRYFFLESHGLLAADPQPAASIYQPVRTAKGLAAFARDVDSAQQVWSSVEGYPGDPAYRDFYRDIGFDLEIGYLKPFLPGGVRTFTGFKYRRVTGKTDQKDVYAPAQALAKAAAHARHFLRSKKDQAAFLRNRLKQTPVIVAAYDAELFGHWWFEGPAWLNHLLRKAESAGIRLTTASAYLRGRKNLQTVAPSESSWGRYGYHATWIDRSNAWMQRHLRRAEKDMIAAAGKYRDSGGIGQRVLNQAARELLLAQASDWPFMMKTGTAVEFARESFTTHLRNVFHLLKMLESGEIRLGSLERIEEKNRIFPEIDFRVFTATP
ncbi:MAG: DUF1957 domain-containing protein [Thermodesulfovibrionales bacterium]